MDTSEDSFNWCNAGISLAGTMTVGDARERGAAPPVRRYEKPQVIVIGDVRFLTAGSASSGKQDANSQYYW